MNITKEKILHYVAAKYILGERLDISINANDAQIECLSELLEISRKLKIKLDEQKDYEQVCLLIKEKKYLANKFENITGIKWRL